MKNALVRLAGLFFLFLAFCAQGQQPAARDVEELMRKSGLANQVGSVFGGLRADATRMRAQALKGAPGDIDDATFERIVRAMERAFSAQRLRQIIAAELARSLSVEDEKQVLAWLDSDIGRRMTALEEARDAEKTDPEARIRESAAYFEGAPLARRELAQRISAALNDGDAAVDQMIAMTTAMVYGMSLADPRFDEAAVTQMKEKLEAERPQASQAFRKLSMVVHAHTYRDVPEADLTRYVDFMESPAGLRFHDATNAALKVAISRAAIDMGRTFMESAPQEPKRS